jgi:hypothetical protein
MIYPSHSDWEPLIAPEPEPEKPCRKGFLHLNFDELQRNKPKMPLHLQKRIVETSRRYAEVREQRKLRKIGIRKLDQKVPKIKVTKVAKPECSIRDAQKLKDQPFDRPCDKDCLHLNSDELQRNGPVIPPDLQKRMAETSRRAAEIREQRNLSREPELEIPKIKVTKVSKPKVSICDKPEIMCSPQSPRTPTSTKSSKVASLKQKTEIVRDINFQRTMIPSENKSPKEKTEAVFNQAHYFAEFLNDAEEAFMEMYEELRNTLPQDEFQSVDKMFAELFKELSGHKCKIESELAEIEANPMEFSPPREDLEALLKRKTEIFDETFNIIQNMRRIESENNETFGKLATEISDQNLNSIAVHGAQRASENIIEIDEILKLRNIEGRSPDDVISIFEACALKAQDLKSDKDQFKHTLSCFSSSGGPTPTCEFNKLKAIVESTVDRYAEMLSKMSELLKEYNDLSYDIYYHDNPETPIGWIYVMIANSRESISESIEIAQQVLSGTNASELNCFMEEINDAINEFPFQYQ